MARFASQWTRLRFPASRFSSLPWRTFRFQTAQARRLTKLSLF